MDGWLGVQAPAKVNLRLEILGRRPDGYHLLRSVVMPVGLFDDVWVQGAVDGGVTCEVEGEAASRIPADRNLATRAAELLRGATGCRAGARIVIRKRIPVGGGLGGGSADAAGALVALNRLWGTGLGREALMALGLQVGCDVPALLHGGAVCMEGVGERVRPLAAAGARWWVVLANPGFESSTRDVYRRHRLRLTPGDAAFNALVLALKEGEVTGAVAGLYNSLAETAVRKYPLIGMLAERMAAAGALGVLMSGSGATVFGLARDASDAQAVAERTVRDAGFPVWCTVVETLPDGVMAAHGPLEARV